MKPPLSNTTSVILSFLAFPATAFPTSLAASVPEAIEKANAQAKKNMRKVALQGTSIPHGVLGVYGRGSVLMMPAAALKPFRL